MSGCRWKLANDVYHGTAAQYTETKRRYTVRKLREFAANQEPSVWLPLRTSLERDLADNGLTALMDF